MSPKPDNRGTKMKTLIIGANGKIGRLLIAECTRMEIPFRAMLRSPEQVEELTAQGIDAAVGDLEGNFEEAMQGCERVIFTAGSGSQTGADKTLLVDLFGSIRAVEAAERANVRMFIMVSSLKADKPLAGPEKIRHYLVARNLADDRLLRSSIPHVILRPGRLLDTPGTGCVTADYDKADANNKVTTISRGNVVAVLLELLRHPLKSGSVIDMIDGDTPIAEFLKTHREEKP